MKYSLLETDFCVSNARTVQHTILCSTHTAAVYRIGSVALYAVLPYFRWERGTWRGVGRHVSCVCWVAFPHFSSRPAVASWLRESIGLVLEGYRTAALECYSAWAVYVVSRRDCVVCVLKMVTGGGTGSPAGVPGPGIIANNAAGCVTTATPTPVPDTAGLPPQRRTSDNRRVSGFQISLDIHPTGGHILYR
jgi:hypothetical protein